MSPIPNYTLDHHVYFKVSIKDESYIITTSAICNCLSNVMWSFRIQIPVIFTPFFVSFFHTVQTFRNSSFISFAVNRTCFQILIIPQNSTSLLKALLYLRYDHVLCWVEVHFNDNGAINLSLRAWCRVLATDTACLVKHVWSNTSHISSNKNLQCGWLIVAH